MPCVCDGGNLMLCIVDITCHVYVIVVSVMLYIIEI